MTAVVGSLPPSIVEAPQCPYRGLLPFAEEDAEYFFGRSADIRLVISNLRAYPLTVLYGPSGVGKSSLLRAGVVRALGAESRRRAAIGRREAIAFCASWQDDARAAVARSIHLAFAPPPAATAAPPQPVPPLDADAVIARCLAEGVSLLLVLDQFEEYFAYHRDPADATAFAEQLLRLMQPASPVRLLISLREDALFQLDQFQASLPGLLDHSLRLDHLDRAGAEEAIRRPLERFAQHWSETPMSADDDLVAALLEQVGAGRVHVSGPVAGEVPARSAEAPPALVEAPFLQLVLTRLWHVERAAGSVRLRRATLDALGGAQTIVGEHVDLVVAALPDRQRELAAELFGYLVTPGGTKIAYTATDLAALTGSPPAETRALLSTLSQGERHILRTVPPPVDQPLGEPRFQVFHDVLALAVAEWRRRYVADQDQRRLQAEAAEARRAAQATRRRLRWARAAVVALSLLLVAAAVAGVLAWRADRAATVNALVSDSTVQLDRDPAASLHAAIDGWDENPAQPGTAVEQALRQAAAAASEDVVLDMGSGVEVLDAVPTPSGSQLVTLSTDGHLRVWSVDGAPRLDLDIDLATALPGTSFDRPGDVLSLVLAKRGTVGVVAANTGAVASVPLTGGDPVLLKEGLPSLPSVAAAADGGGDEVLVWGYGFASLVDVSTAATRALDVPKDAGVVAALSADGTRTAVFQYDSTKTGTLRVCSVDHLRDCTRLPAGTTWISQLTFVPGDATRLVAADYFDFSILAWDTDAVGEPSTTWTSASYGVEAITFDPSGRRMAVAVDKTSRVYDITDASSYTTDGWFLVQDFHGDSPDWALPLAFSKDGNLVAEGNRDGVVRVYLADRSNNRPLAELRGHTGMVTAMHLFPDGQRLVTAAEDGTVRIWRMPGTDTVRSWGLDAEGQWLLSGRPSAGAQAVVGAVSARGCAHLVAPGSGKVVARCDETNRPSGVINDADLDAAGERVVLVTTYGTVGLYTRAGGDLRPDAAADDAPTPTRGSWVSARWCRGASAGTVLLGSDRGELVAWSPGDAKPRWRKALDPFWQVFRLDVARDGATAVAALDNGDLVVLDPATGTERQRLHPGVRSVAVALDARGEVLVAAGVDRVVRRWRLGADQAPKWAVDGGPGTLSRVAVSPDGRYVAVVGAGAATVVLDAESGRRLASLTRHVDAVNDVFFLDDGDDGAAPAPVLVTTSDDGTVAEYPCQLCVLGGAALRDYAAGLLPDYVCGDGTARSEQQEDEGDGRCPALTGAGTPDA